MRKGTGGYEWGAERGNSRWLQYSPGIEGLFKWRNDLMCHLGNLRLTLNKKRKIKRNKIKKEIKRLILRKTDLF